MGEDYFKDELGSYNLVMSFLQIGNSYPLLFLFL